VSAAETGGAEGGRGARAGTGPGTASAAGAGDRTDAGRFVRLSVALTGFDADELAATGMTEVYWALVRRQSGARRYEELVGTADLAAGELHDRFERDAALGGLARAVCHLWYLGAWPGVPGEDGPPVPSPVSAHAYANALVWRTFGGHAPGTGRPGYGSWALPPAALAGGAG